MKSQFQPWQLLLLILAGWINRRHIEHFIRSAKEECLERMIFFGERSLQVAVAEFLSHFHAERNHQGLDNRLIEPGQEVGRTPGEVVCRERLGGMLRYYYRKAV